MTPPPARRTHPIWYILVTIALLWGVWAFVFAPGLRGVRTPGASPASHTVVYRVTGGKGYETAGLTWTNKTGDTEQKQDAKLPWELSFTAKPGAFVYISAQNREPTGSVLCTILVDGVAISNATGDGGYQIAGCKGTVPR